MAQPNPIEAQRCSVPAPSTNSSKVYQTEAEPVVAHPGSGGHPEATWIDSKISVQGRGCGGAAW